MLEQNKSASLKEEVVRKDKLVRSLRKNKISSDAEILRLNQIVKSQDVKISKLSSSENMKADLIKSLKRQHEETVVAASDREMCSPTVQELLKRISDCEGEKTRMQSRHSAVKAKLDSALGQLDFLKAEIDRLSPYEAKCEDIRLSNQRKDAALKSYKEVVEKTSDALERMRKEYEKFRNESTSETKYKYYYHLIES